MESKRFLFSVAPLVCRCFMVFFNWDLWEEKGIFCLEKKNSGENGKGTCEHVSLKRVFVQLSRQNLNTRPKKRYRQVVPSNKFFFSPGTCRDDENLTIILLMTKILHQLIGSFSHYLQGFIHSRWCRISSINSMFSNGLVDSTTQLAIQNRSALVHGPSSAKFQSGGRKNQNTVVPRGLKKVWRVGNTNWQLFFGGFCWRCWRE